MDFKDSIKQLAERILKNKELVRTEEATKHSFVMPFIQALGYDVFNPEEVVPEFIADLGIKKGEKVDYAIIKEGKPIILIECKHWSSDLNPHNSQLFRYFHTTSAKFSILTNGFESRFYTDLVEPNKMDEKPFFTFDINDIRENQLEQLKKFHKTYFDSESVFSTANELKYISEIKQTLNAEMNSPSPDFVKLLVKKFETGMMTPKKLEQFTLLVKNTFAIYINDLITDRLKTALKNEEKEQNENEAAAVTTAGVQKVETTAEELESFYIIRSILRKTIDAERIVHRDNQSYFAINLDDNNRKPICRVHLNGSKKYITVFDDKRKERREDIKGLNDIFNLSDILIATVKSYQKNGNETE